MSSTLLTLTLVLLAAGEPEKTPRKPSGVAPSLPALSPEEEKKIEDVVERLIRTDVGRLQGPEALKVRKEFDALKPEAIPALIRGLNRSAKLNHSCPVLLISEKLTRLLTASDDPILLEFARDEIGAGVGRSSYSGRLQDLRFKCLMRKNALARRAPIPVRGPAGLSTSQLAKLANNERGPRLHALLAELAKRDEKEVLPALAFAAESYDKETQKLARELLDAWLGRQSVSQVVERLQDDAVEVRKSAIRVIAAKHPDFISKISDRLTDDNADVRAEARAALARTVQKRPK